MFPLVIKQMQKHFSCSNSDFGGPMVVEVTNSTEDEEEDETEVIIIGIFFYHYYIVMNLVA